MGVKKYRDKLVFDAEFQLSKKPLQIDLLVIKNIIELPVSFLNGEVEVTVKPVSEPTSVVDNLWGCASNLDISNQMCKIVNIKIGDRNIKVADIKKKYISNIVDAAEKCIYIDRVILFGSSIMEGCRESSDIDIAVFGSASKGKALTSKSYKEFAGQLYAFDDYNQSYDILYFKSGKDYAGGIMNDIENGEVIYARK